MLLQFASDLHLDQRTKTLPRIDPHADILALVGDLGNPETSKYWEYLSFLRPKFKRILLVPGNHEYLYHTLEESDELLRNGCARLDIDLLQCNEVIIDQVRFLGCTLWTNPVRDAFDMAKAKKGKKWTKDLTYEKLISLHSTHKTFLETSITDSEKSKMKTVVLTHHAPLLEMNGYKHADPLLSTMFVSAQNHLFRDPVVAWICGHTHFNTTTFCNKIPCMTNCSGYPGERTDYRYDRIISII